MFQGFRCFFLLLAFFVLTEKWAMGEVGRSKESIATDGGTKHHRRVSRSMVACNQRDLRRRHCDLALGPYRIAMTPDRATIANGIWKNVQDLPIREAGTEWERVELRQLGTRWIMEFEFLTPARGEISLQDLIWVVFELDGAKWTSRVQEVIQKKRVKGDLKKQSELKERYGLRFEKNGSIHWWAGRAQGEW